MPRSDVSCRACLEKAVGKSQDVVQEIAIEANAHRKVETNQESMAQVLGACAQDQDCKKGTACDKDRPGVAGWNQSVDEFLDEKCRDDTEEGP
jgi:hypothetical protein